LYLAFTGAGGRTVAVRVGLSDSTLLNKVGTSIISYGFVFGTSAIETGFTCSFGIAIAGDGASTGFTSAAVGIIAGGTDFKTLITGAVSIMTVASIGFISSYSRLVGSIIFFGVVYLTSTGFLATGAPLLAAYTFFLGVIYDSTISSCLVTTGSFTNSLL